MNKCTSIHVSMSILFTYIFDNLHAPARRLKPRYLFFIHMYMYACIRINISIDVYVYTYNTYAQSMVYIACTYINVCMYIFVCIYMHI